MKMQQKLIAGALALSAMAGVVPAAYADVAATLGLANEYYWRGFDLGGGAAATADIKYTAGGFYAGAWTSSGDATNGTEYDLYSGYTLTSGDFKADFSLVSYNYPAPKAYEKAQVPGDYTEAVLALGYGPVTATYYKSISAKHNTLADNTYSYATLALVLDKFTFKLGEHFSDLSGPGSLDGVVHLDATYAYNDKLSFTIGGLLDSKDYYKGTDIKDTANFVVGLTLPIQ